MIYITDNFLNKNTFKKLQEYALNSEFQVVDTKLKSFLALKTPEPFISLFKIEGHKLILSFIRKAHKNFDTDLRIHADNKILKQKTSMASVLYLDKGNATPNGTAFYKHKHYGYNLPKDISDEEFDKVLGNDSNNINRWEEKDKIYSRPNRLLVYDSNYFHSKFPKIIEKGERIVLVNFYVKD